MFNYIIIYMLHMCLVYIDTIFNSCIHNLRTSLSFAHIPYSLYSNKEIQQ